jgi:hypothetical protein
MMDVMNGGAVICTRCWMGSSWYEESWKRGTGDPDTFIPPLAKELRNFPVKPDEAGYERLFDGASLTDYLELGWDESKFPAYREYCKKHDLIMELQGGTARDILKRIVIPDIEQPQPLEMGFTGHLSLIVKTKPKVLYAKPLPPKRPLELRTAKAEYRRSSEALRNRYVNELLQMLKRAGKNSDDLAKRAVVSELMTMALPKESDANEITKLLIGKWRGDRKSDNTWGPVIRRERVWNQGYQVDEAESAPWHVEGNQLIQSYPKREDSGDIRTDRYTIILLNKSQLVCVQERESDEEVPRSVESWEKIQETKHR